MERIAKIMAAAAAVALAAALASCAPAQSESAQSASNSSSASLAKVSIALSADGWNGDSTPAIAHIVSSDGKVDFYHALAADGPSTVELPDGSYTVSWVTPINADGSIYSVPKPTPLAVKDGKAEALSARFERIAAEDVTSEQMEQAVGEIASAVAKGDPTLSGDAGKAIVERAARNAAAAGKIDASVLSEVAAGAAPSAPAETAPGAAAPTQQNQAAQGGNAGGTAQGGGASESDSGSGQGTDPGGNSGSGGGEPDPPAHVHTWATRTVSDGQNWVVDQPAWDEQVAVGSHYHCTCGYDWYDQSMIAHQKEAGCNVSAVTDYEWVHHDEVGHFEESTHTETYCTGCGAVQ